MRIVPAILLLPLLVLSAPVMVGVDGSGVPMKYGSGWGGGNSYIAPVVCNDGRVAFVAPMPDMADSATSGYRGAYMVDIGDRAQEPAVLFDGCHFFFTQLLQTNERLAADGARNNFFVYRLDTQGDSKNYVLAGTHSDNSSDYLDASVPVNAYLNVNHSGTEACVMDLGGNYYFVPITEDGFGNMEKAADPIGQGDGRSMGFSRDGNGVFFASREAIGGESAGLLRIFRYDRTGQKLDCLAQAQGASAPAITNGAEIASAGEADAFAFVSNNPVYAGQGNSMGVLGTQIMMAKPDAEGNWNVTWCRDESRTVYRCTRPAVSADGRFVVFLGYATSSADIAQVYRYDTVSGKSAWVSTYNDAPANANCYTPAISPNGRFVSFVTKATNLADSFSTENANVWAVDMGPSPVAGTTEMLTSEETAMLEMNAGGIMDTGKITISWEGSLPGRLFYKQDAVEISIANGVPFDATDMPVYFQTDGTRAEITLTVMLTEGGIEAGRTTHILSVKLPDLPKVSHVSCTSSGGFVQFGGGYSSYGGSFAMSGDGTVVAFTSSVKLVTDDVQTGSLLYVRNMLTEVTSLLTDLPSVGGLTVSGDGNVVFFLRNGGLYKSVNEGAPELAAENLTEAVATSFDGSCIACIRGGKPWLYGGTHGEKLAEEGEFSKPMLSMDGNVAAFLKRNGDGWDLYVWNAGTNELRLWQASVSNVSLSMSGAWALIRHDSKWKKLGSDGEMMELPLPEGVESPSLSGNGCYVAYKRIIDGVIQACRFDIAKGIEKIASLSPDGANANAGMNSAPVISLDGSKLCFPTSASNLVAGKNGVMYQELYLSVFADGENNGPVITSALSADEKDTGSIFLPLEYTDADGNDALLELVSQPWSGTCSLLPPHNGGKWYSLEYTPAGKHFCGVVTFDVKVCDGVAYNTQTLTLTVNNVNDSPGWKTTVVKIETEEGGTAGGLDMSQYAEDPDLNNPPPDTDELVFSLADAPAWVSIIDNVISCNPGYDVARRDVNDGKAVVIFQCVVTDKGGIAAELNVEVTVSNTNRPPAIEGLQTVVEGSEVSWGDFMLSDPDSEDEGLLKVRFAQPAKGKWVDKNGNAVSSDLTEADFPVRYYASEGQYNEDTCAVCAVDGAGETSISQIINIKLKNVLVDTSAIWGIGNASMPEVPGWALLSTPVDVKVSDLMDVLGGLLWIWTGGGYAVAEGTLEAGTGFLAYIAGEPVHKEITCVRGRSRELVKGWNLTGVTLDGNGSFGADISSWRLSSQCLINVKGVPAKGNGCWIFKK